MAYNIGDKVTIKESLDPGCKREDYQCCFTSEMIKNYGGKTFTIIERENDAIEPTLKYPSDGFLYKLEGGGHFNWTIGMFKSSEKKAAIKIKKRPIKLNYSL